MLSYVVVNFVCGIHHIYEENMIEYLVLSSKPAQFLLPHRNHLLKYDWCHNINI